MKADYRHARVVISWIFFGLLALTIAGLLSFVLVVGRVPWFQHWIRDPELARRCLVVHVNLAMVFWLSSIFIAFFVDTFQRRDPRHWPAFLPGLAIVGMGLMIFPIVLPSASPVLSNYIPVLRHPLFFTGLVLTLVSIGMAYLGGMGQAIRHRMVFSSAVTTGLVHVGVGYGIFLLTLLLTTWQLTPSLGEQAYYNALFWGAGHVFQSVNVMGMVTLWMIFLEHVSVPFSFSVREARWIFGLLLAPLFLAPYLALRVNSFAFYYLMFTRMMQFGIFPGVLLFFVLLARKMGQASWARSWRSIGRSPYGWGLVTGMGLIVLGFLMGAFIRSATTLVPAHYHAAIGAITVTNMVGVYWLAGRYFTGASQWLRGWLPRLQPALFGIGQTLFALGFGIARLSRKVYGSEQVVQHGYQYAGLALMGLGGALAIAGGILFIIFAGQHFPWKTIWIPIKERRTLWPVLKSIPFKN